MPKFGAKSMENLSQANGRLTTLFLHVVKGFDCTVLESHRGRERQEALYLAGRSRVRYPDSKHNSNPSLAVDVAPYPIVWRDTARFYFFAGYVKGIASQLGYKIRWGGDWDLDTQVRDQRFNDLPHFELIE